MSTPEWLTQVEFGPDGLVPVVAQDALSGDVLMLAWADREAIERTLDTGAAHYFSRSRKALWRKGESSGHTQQVRAVRRDCDSDALLYLVDQSGPACHTGARTCFEAGGGSSAAHTLQRLATIIRQRAEERPAQSHTVRLLDHGIPTISQKVGEEAVEVVVAANAQDDGRLTAETADLLYHLLVLLHARGVPLDAVWRELDARSR